MTFLAIVALFESAVAVCMVAYFRKMIHKEDKDWANRPILDDGQFKEFFRYIKEDCEGYYLARAATCALFNSGYRLSAAQIYQLCNIDRNAFGFYDKNSRFDQETCKKFLKYYDVVECEAEEKVTKLLIGSL